MQNIFFVVHDQESYGKHPDLIGFYVKTDLDGKPIKDKNGEFIPDHSFVNKIELGDKIIYYTRGDYLIRGIFEVKEKLKEDSERRAADWQPTVQFVITPVLKPKTSVDFRNLIFSGKYTLDMFKHLENLKRQWGMSIGGRNYIRKITMHDYEIIEEAIKATFKPEIREEIELPKFPRKHLEIQFKLVKILKSYGYQVHVARSDKNKIIEKGEEVLETIPEFHSEYVCDIASRIDCVAFDEYNVPTVLTEVVDTPGTLTDSLFRLNEIAVLYPGEEVRFLIVAPEKLRRDFEEKIESNTFKRLKKANCTFRPYYEINMIFREALKRKPKL